MFAYTYDNIGNRLISVKNAQVLTWEPNAANQYSNGRTYDTRGNLTKYLGTNYVWDGECRLVSVVPSTLATGSTKVEFAYDYMGRRYSKKVYSYNSGWSLSSETSFLYDGWNVVAEVRSQNSEVSTNYFVWGLDLSGSLQGAGGIGGLLSSTRNTGAEIKTAFYCYDANGNVTDLINPDGSSAAHYEYSPYGEIISSTGPEAENNKFRFSAKYYDDETDLGYWGYRYYSPEMGRFISRDPSEEMGGGNNTYRFVSNNPIDEYDVLGLWGTDVHRDMTKDWAICSDYSRDSAARIGEADEAVDNGRRSPLPLIGDQSYHFNTNFGGEDSRLKHLMKHFQLAKDSCDKSQNTDNPVKAIDNLGKALHPLQDWYAHGDFPGGFLWHNINGPLAPGFRRYEEPTPVLYPETVSMDALGSADGRPVGSEVRASNRAKFTFGFKRIKGTEQMTKFYLRAFLLHIKGSAKECGECKKKFLREETL